MRYDLRMDEEGILVIFPSDAGREFDAFMEETFDPFLEAATQAQPLRLLVDAQQVGKLSQKTRKTLARLGHDPRVERCAILGGGRYQRTMANFFNRAAGRDHVRLFGSREKARAWLGAQRQEESS